MLSKINLGIFKTVFTGVRPPPTPPPAVTPKFKRDDRCTVMGIDFGVIGAADFNNAIRFYVRRPTHQNIKIFGLFGTLISITTLDFMSADLPAG